MLCRWSTLWSVALLKLAGEVLDHEEFQKHVSCSLAWLTWELGPVTGGAISACSTYWATEIVWEQGRAQRCLFMETFQLWFWATVCVNSKHLAVWKAGNWADLILEVASCGYLRLGVGFD